MMNYSWKAFLLSASVVLCLTDPCLTQLRHHFPRRMQSAEHHLHDHGAFEGPLANDIKIKYFSQPVDHFSYANKDTFMQRYIVIDKYFDGKGGPVFFYTGNEGDIVLFMNNTGLMFDWAPDFKALLIFAEHRYYGETMPYGKDSFKDLAHLGYLTAEQALADFVTLIDFVKRNTSGAENSPVIAFGGSYGGMLSAWLRMKYPQTVVGALAASAPIWNFEDLVPCGGFFEIITRDFKAAGPNCASNIRRSWDVITKTASTPDGLTLLSSTFNLCNPLKDGPSLINWLSNAWVSLGMVDYPYAADFLMPLPGWPIKVTCSHLTAASPSDIDLLKAVKDAANVFYNYTGTQKCFDLSTNVTPGLGDSGWNFQTCTEMVMPECSDGVHDMFPVVSWDLAGVIAGCQAQYGVTPRPHWIVEQFGGKNIQAASNIIFSNGRLDPWSFGGVLTNLSSTLTAIVIADGAHHLDLRAASSLDPDSVVQARLQEKKIIQGWIKKYRQSFIGGDMGLVSEGDQSDIAWDDSSFMECPSVLIYVQNRFRDLHQRLMMIVILTLLVSVLLLFVLRSRRRRIQQSADVVCLEKKKMFPL